MGLVPFEKRQSLKRGQREVHILLYILLYYLYFSHQNVLCVLVSFRSKSSKTIKAGSSLADGVWTPPPATFSESKKEGLNVLRVRGESLKEMWPSTLLSEQGN